MHNGDRLFKGLTRPATLLGVTYAGLIVNMVITSVAFLMMDSLLYLLLFLPLHLVIYMVCLWDERFFDLLVIYCKTKGSDPHRIYYRAPTHCP